MTRERRNYDAAEAKIHRASDSGPLFETGIAFPAPSNPSATSENAADDLTFTATGRARRETQLLRILRLISQTEAGKTIDELDADTGLGTGSLCARISDLRAAGLIDTSETISRTTRRGKLAFVHFATAIGRKRIGADDVRGAA